MSDLGPAWFTLKEDIQVKRTDFDVKSSQGKKLQCSHFEHVETKQKKVPCVIYLHGNSSGRPEALPIVDLLLPLGISVLTFDFAGCGMSEGEYISLGWHERDDLEIVIE